MERIAIEPIYTKMMIINIYLKVDDVTNFN